MDRLEKLHYALELVVMLEQYLNLPRLTLSVSARHALKHYETSDVDPTHVFTVPVATSAIAGLLDKFQPSSWSAQLSSTVAEESVHSVYQFSVCPPFAHVSCDDELLASDSAKQNYFLTTVTQQALVV